MDMQYDCKEPARLIFSSLAEKSAPKGNYNIEPSFGATFGIEKVDFDAIVKIMVELITAEMGSFSGKGSDYYLACMSSETAVKRALQKADFDAQGKPSDEALKIRERAEKRGELYKPYAGILVAKSKYPIQLARLVPGAIEDIPDEPVARQRAGKDYFYPGAYVIPAITLRSFRRKNLDAKDGVTAFIQNCLFVRNGERLSGGGGRSNDQVFGGYVSRYSDFDPTANAPSNTDMDDEAAF